MRRLSMLFVVAVSLAGVSTEGAQRYLVATKAPAKLSSLKIVRDAAEARAHGVQEFEVVNGFAATLTDEEAEALRRTPGVRFLEPDRELTAMAVAPMLDEVPYGIKLVGADRVWDVTKGSPVRVGIIDTGIDPLHPDLQPIIDGGWNFINESAAWGDDNGHGTHVAGTVAALHNDAGVAGVAPGVTLVALKMLSGGGSGYTSDLIQAVDYAVRSGIDIISLSLGSPQPSILEQEAFARAARAGVLAIAASGNDSADSISYPAGYPTVLAVGAVNQNSQLASFSNRGTGLGVVAPGVSVLSTVPRGSSRSARVQVGFSVLQAMPLVGSGMGTATGVGYHCGIGLPGGCPSGVRGNIAVIERGTLSFAEKVKNARAAGAVAVVIYNSAPGLFAGTLLMDPADANYPFPISVGIGREEGLAIRNGDTLRISAASGDYGILSGTSMATPHVTGVAALVWSLAPDATAEAVRNALTSTATDLGPQGWDPAFGYGLVNAYEAAKALAPGKFGEPAPAARRRALR